MARIHKFEKQIESQGRKALGYESTLDFNYGFISALLKNKLINRKEYNILAKVYTSVDNEDCDFYIDKKGNLAKYEDID